MKEIILLIIAAGVIFIFTLAALISGVIKKNKTLKRVSLFAFISFLLLSGFTGYRFISKSYHAVTNSLKPRSGDEIYDALFGKSKFDCVKVLNKQDQVVPKIDYAICLQFNTCPEELTRILSRHRFTFQKLPATQWNAGNTGTGMPDWFNPATLGDSIMVFEYATYGSSNIQTIWTSLDSTKVFVRDIAD
ncbi:MAG: hypothetical protein JST86_13145 [Bacteroidetes bacterium]|nr:hypothetical protein [Bacteroidota bacterium]